MHPAFERLLPMSETQVPADGSARDEHASDAFLVRRQLHGTSAVGKYRELVVGRPGLGALLGYEAVTLLASPVPGALGLLLRRLLYPRLLGSVGRKPVFGRDVVLRHPHKIHLGDEVIVDDNCLLDAKGADNSGIRIGNRVFIGRNTILSCKNGDIVLEDGVNIGFNCEIFSGSRVTIGENGLLAAYCYVIGGGHEFQNVERPVQEQAAVSRGVRIDGNVWLGAGVKVLDGVHIGGDTVVGAGAVVTGDLPSRSVAAGVPARVVRER